VEFNSARSEGAAVSPEGDPVNLFELITQLFFIAIGVAAAKLAGTWFGRTGEIVGFVVGASAVPLLLWLVSRATRLRPPSE
jgi:hypothetical protein